MNNYCLKLKELDGTFGVSTPAIVLEKLTNLKKLETLEFNCCHTLTGNNLLLNIASNCKNLVKLYIDECNVTEVSLIQVGKLQYLEELELNNIPNVPNAMFNDFCKLKYLDCYNCPTVADEGIVKVIDNCKNLSRLYIRRTGITVKTPIHASNRQFVYVDLLIVVHGSVGMDYNLDKTIIKSPYLRVNWD